MSNLAFVFNKIMTFENDNDLKRKLPEVNQGSSKTKFKARVLTCPLTSYTNVKYNKNFNKFVYFYHL